MVFHTYSLEALDSMPDILNQLLKRIEHKDENIINELRNGYNYACSEFLMETLDQKME